MKKKPAKSASLHFDLTTEEGKDGFKWANKAEDMRYYMSEFSNELRKLRKYKDYEHEETRTQVESICDTFNNLLGEFCD